MTYGNSVIVIGISHSFLFIDHRSKPKEAVTIVYDLM